MAPKALLDLVPRSDEAVEGFQHVVRAHVYDKCWQLDITWAEVEQLIEDDDVVEETEDEEGRLKRVRLLEGWRRPLHVVEVVDEEQELIVYVTIYEPDLDHWQRGFRARRR